MEAAMIQRNFVVFTASAFLFPIVFPIPSLIASQENSNKSSKTEVIQKTKKLQIPFIANNGQTSRITEPLKETDYVLDKKLRLTFGL